ncbi:MAG TPA: HYR domain-containing protein, partial [Polyangia bacterium]|nr:HYR domain-containing protein [Polyangia bacterium]
VTVPGLPPAPTVVGSTDILSGSAQVSVNGTGTPGATIKVKVGATTYTATVAADTNGDGLGVWTLTVLNLAPGAYDLSFTQTTPDGTSDTGASVKVKVPLPALVVNQPADGASITNQLTVSGTAASTFGDVVVGDGDGRFFAERATVPVSASSGAFAGPTPGVALDYGRHQLKIFQRANGLDGDGVLRTVLVKPPLGALAITALVSGGVETVLPGVPTLDTDVIVNGTGGLPRTGPNGTGMPGRVVVYRGLTATDPAPVKIGEATLADDGSFSVSVRLIGAGSRYLSVSQVASSLSGGGTAESDARTTPVHVLVRPGPPTITQTSTDPAPNDLRLTVTGTVPQVGAQTVTITADGGTPARTVSVNANVQSNGTFTGILQLPLSGTYSVTAFQTADTASGPASQPPVLVVAGDVTAPDVTDAGGNPVVVPAVSAASADGAIVNFSSLVYSADNGSAPAHCLPATAPALNCVCLPASGSTFALGTTTVTCAATDAAGNTGTTTFPVTVKSTIPPDIAVSNVTAEAQGPEGAVVSYQVSASGFIVDCAEPGSGEVRPCMSWKPAHTGLGFTPQAAAVNPIDGTVYAGFFGRFSEADAAGASHLFKLPPGATDWVALTGPSTGPIRQIVLGHGATPRLYLPADPTGGTAANQGVWISGDGGDSWSLALSGLSIAGVAIDPGATAQDHLLAWTNVAGGGLGGRTSPAGLYESFDGGITWAGAGAGLPLVQILSVALDPSQPGRMYASVLPDSAEIVKTKVFRRKDAGAWQRLSIPALSPITNPVNTTIARSLWVAPAVPACTPPSQCQTFPTLFAGRWMSRDGGETFSRNLFGFDFAAMVFDRVLDAANPGRIIFAAGSINNLFKSIDYGKTWSPTSFFAAPIVQGGSFAQDHFDGNRLYAASSLGLFRSVLTSTQQLNWVPMASPGLSLPGVNIKDLAVDPINPSVAYAVSEFGLFKTQDSGNSWAASNLGLDDPFAFQGLGQVLVDRFDRNTVYLGSRMGLSDATWKSPNAGVNWTALQHTACPGDGDSCFPGGASLQQASGRLTLDPLVRGNWISVSETSASNFSYRLQDSDLGPIRGTLLINPTDTSGWVAGISSPFAYRGLLVPGVERSLLVSFATLGGFGLGGAAQSNGGLDFIHYDGSLVPAAGGAAFQQGKWAGLGTSNVVLDGSDGTNRLYVSGSAIGQDASKLYRATVATVRDNPPASVVWEQLGGGTAFAQTQFTTLLIDPASGGQRMYTIGRRTGAADPGDALWESHDGGRNWQMDDTAPPYLSRLWVSAADGALFATITPAALDTTGLYYSASRNDPSIEKPGGVLWRRELTQDTETKPGARVVRADLRVSCDYPSTVPANDPRRQRAIGAGATFPVGPTTLHCTATDVFGNSSTNDITITVTDTTPPAITTPSSLASTAPSGGTVPVAFTVTAADAVDGPITPTCVPASGSAFAIGATTVQCSATDAHGNSARAAFPVIVSQSSAPALTPPTLTTPGDLAVEATGPNPNAATVTLPVSGATAGGAALTPTCTAATTDGTAVALAGTPPAGTFSFGITNVTCSVTDTGTTPPLTVTRVFRVTVKDTTAPHIVAPTQLAAPFGSPVSFTVTATDAVTSPVTPSCSPSSPASFPLGKTIVNCQAADAAGNQAFAKITVTVTDQNPPVLHLADMTVDADDALGARTSYVPAPGFAHFATDVEDQTQGLLPTVTCVPAA